MTTEIKEKIILIMMKYKMSNKLKKALEKFHDEIESDTEESSYIYKKQQAIEETVPHNDIEEATSDDK